MDNLWVGHAIYKILEIQRLQILLPACSRWQKCVIDSRNILPIVLCVQSAMRKRTEHKSVGARVLLNQHLL